MDRRRDYAPPANWQDFEDLCLNLWRSRLIDAKKHGRAGQPQAGVDIFGRDPKTETWVGIQCKQKRRWPKKVLTVREIEAEAEQAESFEPPLSLFIVATTAPRDVETQRFVRELNDRRREEGKFSVDLFAWDDLQDLLQEGTGLSASKPGNAQPDLPTGRRSPNPRIDKSAPARFPEEPPDRAVDTGGTYSVIGKQVFDPKGHPVGSPHPSRSSAKRAAHQLAAPGDLQRKNRARLEGGYRLLVHPGCHLFDWFEPESRAYLEHRKRDWRMLTEMDEGALWAFTERNVLPLISFDGDARNDAWELLQKDPGALRVWIERKLAGFD